MKYLIILMAVLTFSVEASAKKSSHYSGATHSKGSSHHPSLTYGTYAKNYK